jgi:hypothetical protein
MGVELPGRVDVEDLGGVLIGTDDLEDAPSLTEVG